MLWAQSLALKTKSETVVQGCRVSLQLQLLFASSLFTNAQWVQFFYNVSSCFPSSSCLFPFWTILSFALHWGYQRLQLEWEHRRVMQPPLWDCTVISTQLRELGVYKFPSSYFFPQSLAGMLINSIWCTIHSVFDICGFISLWQTRNPLLSFNWKVWMFWVSYTSTIFTAFLLLLLPLQLLPCPPHWMKTEDMTAPKVWLRRRFYCRCEGETARGIWKVPDWTGTWGEGRVSEEERTGDRDGLREESSTKKSLREEAGAKKACSQNDCYIGIRSRRKGSEAQPVGWRCWG